MLKPIARYSRLILLLNQNLRANGLTEKGLATERITEGLDETGVIE